MLADGPGPAPWVRLAPSHRENVTAVEYMARLQRQPKGLDPWMTDTPIWGSTYLCVYFRMKFIPPSKRDLLDLEIPSLRETS